MKIAVPTRDNRVDGHFGHCEMYSVITISQDNTIERTELIPAPEGCGCKSDIAAILADNGVEVMLAGNMGAGALQVLNRHGIEVIRGCQGLVDDVVKSYIGGKVTDSGVGCQQHERHHGEGHHHEHGHSCQH